MQWAALVVWILTAGGGLVLATQWLRGDGLHQAAGIRAARLASHVVLAVIGLALWIAYVATEEEVLAWIAVALLVAVAVVGFSMFAIWLRGHSSRGEPTEMPAETAFPLPLVLGHGALGVTTLALSFLAALGVAT